MEISALKPIFALIALFLLTPEDSNVGHVVKSDSPRYGFWQGCIIQRNDAQGISYKVRKRFGGYIDIILGDDLVITKEKC